MMASVGRRLGVLSILVLFAVGARAWADDVPSIVVTPYFVPTSIARAGGTISVISREQIARSSAGTLVDVLRSAPGVTVTESGGAGGQALVYLRGAEPQHTLVLIDGIRVNDVSSARDEFDFASFAATDIERIEILRGPQSALYGSDAIGGVINIITRRPPSSGARYFATVEGGSYGTARTTLSAAQTSGAFSLSGSGTYFNTAGFSRVGNRDTDEPDGTQKFAGNLRGSVDLGQDTKLEFGVDGYQANAAIDGAPPTPTTLCPAGNPCYQTKLTAAADAPNTSDRTVIDAFGRFSFAAFGGALHNSFTVSDTSTSRVLDQLNGVTMQHYNYSGSDIGGDYQGVLTLDRGSLVFGSGLHSQAASNANDDPFSPDFNATRALYDGYVLYQLPIGDRLDLSFAGRYDGEFNGNGFTTGRVTAAYDIPETETRFHASAGTGAKLPTAFELSYNAALVPEQSFGVDFGVGQTLFDGRLSLDATGFYNRFHNLIDFDFAIPPSGGYANIKDSATAGVELSGTANVVPGKLSATASYTYLYAQNLDTGFPLQRRPVNSGKVSVTYTGIQNLSATLSATLVGARNNNDATTASPPLVLPAYARVDLEATYRVNDAVSVFGRIENLLNATYQDPWGYNTAGLSVYAGLTWSH
jgi:vitamin B12 transporter